MCGNKCDLESERVVDREEGQQLGDSWNCPFFEISALTGENVEMAFFQLVREARVDMKPTKKGGCTLL
uniref:Small monomeric GTPase n=1 Tax=Arcella intermedia TaxID=1963864 RepID=A0A6B2LYA5_9EUKA